MLGENDTKSQFKTSADKAYDIICSKILSGELKPGQKLTRRGMAQLTNFSIIPVIEALHKLENEGLVESKPQWGSNVIELNDEIIEDRYALREAVECQVARILAQKINENQKSYLFSLAEKLDNAEQAQLFDDNFWNNHLSFHISMAEYTGHESLVTALHRISLFNLLHKSELSTLRRKQEIPSDNHQRLVKEIASGNSQKAEDAMRTHILQSGLLKEVNK